MNELTPDQVRDHGGPLHIGNKSAKCKVLILASCRGIPYADYILRFTKENPEVIIINPHNYGTVGCDEQFVRYENDSRFLDVFRMATVFIYEPHYRYSLFNTDRSKPKNVWQFGLKPEETIEVPAFHNHFILALDQWRFVPEFSVRSYRWTAMKHLARFMEHCSRSSFPGLDEWFLNRWTSERLFWNQNHVSKAFSLEVFERMCDILNWNLNYGWKDMAHQYRDIYLTDITNVTALDIQTHHLSWPEIPVELPKEPHVMTLAEAAHAAL